MGCSNDTTIKGIRDESELISMISKIIIHFIL